MALPEIRISPDRLLQLIVGDKTRVGHMPELSDGIQVVVVWSKQNIICKVIEDGEEFILEKLQVTERK